MDAFHGIPSSNLLDDGQSISGERLHDVFCPAPWDPSSLIDRSLKFCTAAGSKSCPNCYTQCTGRTLYDVDRESGTTLSATQQERSQGCRVAGDRWSRVSLCEQSIMYHCVCARVSLRGHSQRRIGDTTADCYSTEYLCAGKVPGYQGTKVQTNR